jgi:serine/threonine protein kinase
MSEVFLALMSAACGSAKPVVIKRLWPELARYPEYVALFLDEARISLQMSHPNVIHAYESGQDGQRHYLTLEYLDGQPLKHVFDGAAVEGGLSLPLAFKVICDVLAGLEYIHELRDLSGRPLGIVHRDVSPQNVFITYEGVVKVVDFGIAQSASTRASQPSRDVKGRIAYMAPEQVAGLAVDRRADLFSVGVMLWELAVGRRLWQGMSEADITQHLLMRKSMPVLPRNRGFPPGLAAICARALAPQPDDRYADASQFLSDLGELMTGSAPVQSRLLADLMGRLFGSSRALTRAMIQQRLQGEGLFPSEEATPEPTGRQGTGEYPASSRSSGKMEAVFDRSANSAIATAGREVTGVNKVPRRWPTRKNGALVTGLGVAAFLVLLVLGVALRDYLSRRAGSTRPSRPASATAPIVAAPSVPPTPRAEPALPETPAPAAPQPPQYTVQEPIVLDARTQKRPKPPQKGTPASRANAGARLTERDFFDVDPKPVRHAPSRAIEQDLFDVDLKTVRRAPRRVMDREDPYKP